MSDFTKEKESMILALTAMNLMEALTRAEKEMKTNPNAAIVYEWFRPTMYKIKNAIDAIEALHGMLKD